MTRIYMSRRASRGEHLSEPMSCFAGGYSTSTRVCGEVLRRSLALPELLAQPADGFCETLGRDGDVVLPGDVSGFLVEVSTGVLHPELVANQGCPALS